MEDSSDFGGSHVGWPQHENWSLAALAHPPPSLQAHQETPKGKNFHNSGLRRPVKSQAFVQKTCFQNCFLQDHTEQESLVAPGLRSLTLRNHFMF